MTNANEWTVEFYSDEHGREPCRDWAEKLSPQKLAAFRAALRLVLIPRGLGVVETEYGKALSGGLYELRIRWSATEIGHKVGVSAADDVGRVPEKIMLRVLFCTAGRKIILLMSGYDKAEDPSNKRQNEEIAKARKLITARQEAKKRAGKRR